jgi:hypothetical protein
MNKKRSLASGNCGTMEIMRLLRTSHLKKNVVCGSIQIRVPKNHSAGRILKLEFRGNGYQKMDVKLLYEIIVDTLEKSGRYKVGWSGHESKFELEEKQGMKE